MTKLPIITFDSKKSENYLNDRDEMCSICLEKFKDKEKLRKLGK